MQVIGICVLNLMGVASDWNYVILSVSSSANYRAFVGHRPQLSFMQIYGQREQVPGSIVIDG